MKLPIRFADQIVGAFLILALGILIFVIFMLGSSQRWFSRDYHFKTYFNSASGLGQNMAVQYKGFTIGHVKSIRLAEDDRVEVLFTVFDTYIDRVRVGSLVEIQTSALAALGGNSFLFHPGRGEDLIDEGETIHTVDSEEGRRILASGLNSRPEGDDGIGNIITQVGTLLTTVNEALAGTDSTSLGRTVKELEGTIAGFRQLAEKLPEDIDDTLSRLMAQIDPILGNVKVLSDQIAAPEGLVMTTLESEEIYNSLVSSLDSVSGILQSLDKTVQFIPSQLPQIGVIISDLQITLRTVQDVLTALTNNPLLRRGIPERKETPVGGTRSRDVEF